MIQNSKKLFSYLLLLSSFTPTLASLTTMQYWDANPIYNAYNSNMPADAHFANITKSILKGNDDVQERRFGFNISPFIQRSVRATDRHGNDYGDYNHSETNRPLARAMSDYQGTPYLMGLFLGADASGNSIWANNDDTQNTDNLTDATIDATALPKNLKDAAKNIRTFLYNNDTAGEKTPALLSQSVLEKDPTYFGAISIPFTYQKLGLRWEANLDVNEHIGIVLKGGVAQLKQDVSPYVSLTNATKANDSDPDTDKIYKYITSAGAGANPSPANQNTFNTNITNNIDELLSATNGANYDIRSYSDFGIEDAEIGIFLRKAIQLHPSQKHEAYIDSTIMTPYLYIGGRVPLSKQKDYTKLFSLSLGDNGHASAGGNAGLCFDFANSIEVGIEAGMNYFFKQDIMQMPIPNHKLQRVLYPYRRDVTIEPGYNWHFKALFSAYEFTPGISFFATYQYMQHTKDSIKLKTANSNFLPQMLEDLSSWSTQNITAAMSFAIQHNIHASLAWQAGINQSNAYSTQTILGTLSFLF